MAQWVEIRVLDYYFDIAAAFHPYQMRALQCALRCGGVGANQAARAKKGAAEITRDDAGDIEQRGMLQHIQRRNARGFLRFPIIGLPHAILLAKYIGVDVVTSHGIFGTDLVDERKRILLRFHVANTSDEAAFPLLVFADGFTLDSVVGFLRHSR